MDNIKDFIRKYGTAGASLIISEARVIISQEFSGSKIAGLLQDVAIDLQKVLEKEILK